MQRIIQTPHRQLPSLLNCVSPHRR